MAIFCNPIPDSKYLSLEETPLGTAEEERSRAKGWMDTAVALAKDASRAETQAVDQFLVFLDETKDKTPIVVFDDGETWCEAKFCKVMFVTEQQMEELQEGVYPKNLEDSEALGFDSLVKRVYEFWMIRATINNTKAYCKFESWPIWGEKARACVWKTKDAGLEAVKDMRKKVPNLKISLVRVRRFKKLKV